MGVRPLCFILDRTRAVVPRGAVPWKTVCHLTRDSDLDAWPDDRCVPVPHHPNTGRSVRASAESLAHRRNRTQSDTRPYLVNAKIRALVAGLEPKNS
jgi:hypothetical protein